MIQFRVIVRHLAESDIAGAAQWYEQRDQGLGTEFFRAVDACISNIARNPQQYPLVFENVRRSLLRRFPFGVFYLINGKTIVVLACLHTKRHPSVFKSRE